MTDTDPTATARNVTQHVRVRRGTFQLHGVYCLCCAAAVERALREQPHITEIRLDRKNDVVHVGYDHASVSAEDIEEVITTTGCDCTQVGDEQPEAMAPPERRMQHLGHGVDV